MSLDINSLYTSIPHHFGLTALEHFLSQDPYMSHCQAQFILEATKFCLSRNYLNFNDQLFLQIPGTAMGANFAPSYANQAMGLWETQYVWRKNQFSKNLIFFGCYIDDILIIWDGPNESTTEFVAHCNNNPHGLSFTYVTDPHKLAFLGLELYHTGDTIQAKKYFKPTAGNSLLHYRSCQYQKWTDDISKGQFWRLRHNCTRTEDYVEQSSILKNKPMEKGYPDTLIQQAYSHNLAKKSPKKKKRAL